MEFEELLDKLWGFDSEIFAYDSLFVFINYRTREKIVFHNSNANELQEWLDKEQPILMGYNCNGYDKYILKGWLNGMTPVELKQLNDFIINGNNGWEWNFEGYTKLPYMWDLMNNIKTFKSLKELEANLRMNITETTVNFNIDHSWNDQETKEVIYYCTCDVEALFPIFERMKNAYKSKYIIARLGNIEPIYALSLTDANLTAVLLGAEKQDHFDNFAYVYPSIIDKSKIPQSVLNYIDDLVEHNDLNYKPKAPSLKIDDCVIQLGLGGLHGCSETTYVYGEGVEFKCE